MTRLVAIGVAALCFPAAAHAQEPPQNLFTGAATPSDTSARVAGYFQGSATAIPAVCWFEYGTTGSFGSRTDTVCSGTSYADLGPLAPGTLYYYRAAASNSAGTNYAATKTFTTLGSPPPGPPAPPEVQPPTANITVLRRQTPSSVARRGLRVQLRLIGACPCTVNGVVRFLGKRAGARRRSRAEGTVTLTVRLNSASRRTLRRARRVTLAVALTIADTAGRSRERTKTVRLRRT